MPFRHAHWWVLATFPLAALAFWPGYISVLGTSPWSYHLHGVTASMWLALMAIQSWSIANGHRQFHRTNGLVSFALFPLFLAGGATIFVGMAERFVSGSPFHALYAPRLAWLDFVAILGMAFFYFQALRYRRFVGKHSSYLLATAIFLLPPMLGRLAPLAMGLDPSQPDFFEADARQLPRRQCRDRGNRLLHRLARRAQRQGVRHRRRTDAAIEPAVRGARRDRAMVVALSALRRSSQQRRWRSPPACSEPRSAGPDGARERRAGRRSPPPRTGWRR